MKKYDAVIIGSGVSGLTTALILGQHGKKIAILEQFSVSTNRSFPTWNTDKLNRIAIQPLTSGSAALESEWPFLFGRCWVFISAGCGNSNFQLPASYLYEPQRLMAEVAEK